MLFNNLGSDEGTIRFKRLPDSILVAFNSLFLIHVILSIIITVNCYNNHQLPYVLSSVFVFLFSFSSILYILFHLNGFVIFYLWSLFVGISICFIPFVIISILFPLISVLFAFIKWIKPISFLKNFWLHSTNYIIFYELVFTIPHTLIYNIMLFNNYNDTFITKYNHNHYVLITLCIIIGIAHWMMTILYCIYFNRDKLIQLTHLLCWNSIIVQIFAIYFQIIGAFLIPISSWIFWLILFIFSVPSSMTYFIYKYRHHLTSIPINHILNWAIINPLINNQYNKQQIQQNIYCMNHVKFHRKWTETTKGNDNNWYFDSNELDHLLFLNAHDVKIPYNMPQCLYQIHEMGDYQCIGYQFEYITDSKQTMRMCKSLYLQIKQYFGIKYNQHYKSILLFGWILSIVATYIIYPLICLINGGVYDNIALQSYIVLLFVIYAVFITFYLLLIYTMYSIQYYIGYEYNHHFVGNAQSVLPHIIQFNRILQRNTVIYNYVLCINDKDKATIARNVIQCLGCSVD